MKFKKFGTKEAWPKEELYQKTLEKVKALEETGTEEANALEDEYVSKIEFLEQQLKEEQKKGRDSDKERIADLRAQIDLEKIKLTVLLKHDNLEQERTNLHVLEQERMEWHKQFKRRPLSTGDIVSTFVTGIGLTFPYFMEGIGHLAGHVKGKVPFPKLPWNR